MGRKPKVSSPGKEDKTTHVIRVSEQEYNKLKEKDNRNIYYTKKENLYYVMDNRTGKTKFYDDLTENQLNNLVIEP